MIKGLCQSIDSSAENKDHKMGFDSEFSCLCRQAEEMYTTRNCDSGSCLATSFELFWSAGAVKKTVPCFILELVHL